MAWRDRPFTARFRLMNGSMYFYGSMVLVWLVWLQKISVAARFHGTFMVRCFPACIPTVRCCICPSPAPHLEKGALSLLDLNNPRMKLIVTTSPRKPKNKTFRSCEILSTAEPTVCHSSTVSTLSFRMWLEWRRGWAFKLIWKLARVSSELESTGNDDTHFVEPKLTFPLKA